LTRSNGEVLFNETFEEKQEEECRNIPSGLSVCSRTGDFYYEWVNEVGKSDGEGTFCKINSGQPLRITEGTSRVMGCEYDYQNQGVDFQEPFEALEFRSSVDYTYIKDAGSREIEVESRG
jgi:hypothetical protein